MSREQTAPHLRALAAIGSPDIEGALAAEPEAHWDGLHSPSPRSGSSRFLTDVIVELGLATRERVDDALTTSRTSGGTPEQALRDSGHLTEEGMARALGERYGLDCVDLTVFAVDMSAANLVSSAAARRYEALPISYIDERILLVAMADPANLMAVDDIAIMTGYEVRPAVAARTDILELLGRLGRFDDVVDAGDEDDVAELVDLRESADDAPIVKLVNQIIARAVDTGASDVHFAPDDRDLRVRFRVDGVLADATTVSRRMVAGVISRLKIMAELDIAERRLPQDGRVSLTVEGHRIDLRVVTLPSVHGESVVIRILDKDSVVMELDRLGMAPAEHERFQRAFTQAHGAVLVTGPTGSGKSTSLYAALAVLNTRERNIITIEDPVEYEIDGITQIQVHAKAGLSFATGLRSMMRADPDVIMVGEIRDRETAQIAVESALTGHLVLSTLHTNDAPSALTRLVEMGIEPFLIASSIDCVVAQRLARTLCAHCKTRTILAAPILRDHGFAATLDVEAYEPVGCARCAGTGYKGRIALYEVMTVNAEIRSLSIARRPAEEIGLAAQRDGMRRLSDDGLEKVRQGRTSIAEVTRVCGMGSEGH